MATALTDSPPLSGLEDALDGLRDEDLHGLPARALGDGLVELRRLLDSLEAEFNRRVARHLRHCLDPDAALTDDLHQHHRRYLHLSETLDGVWYLDGRLDAEGGAILRTTLDAIAGTPSAGEQRSAAQRRADALVELGCRDLDRGELARAGGQRPHLSLIADLATL